MLVNCKGNGISKD